MQQKQLSSRLVTAAHAACLLVGGLAPALAAAQGVAPGSTLTFGGSAHVVEAYELGVDLTLNSAATGPGNTGAFAFLNAAPGTALTVRPFRVGQGPQGMAGLLTVGGYTFNLSALPSGRFFDYNQCYVAPLADGQRCSPYQAPGTDISPFELVNIATGDPALPFYSVASFRLMGTVSGPGGGPASSFVGTFTAPLPADFRTVLGALESSGDVGLNGLGYTAVFEVGPTVVPEPTTVTALGAGLLGLAGLARRRRARPTA